MIFFSVEVALPVSYTRLTCSCKDVELKLETAKAVRQSLIRQHKNWPKCIATHDRPTRPMLFIRYISYFACLSCYCSLHLRLNVRSTLIKCLSAYYQKFSHTDMRHTCARAVPLCPTIVQVIHRRPLYQEQLETLSSLSCLKISRRLPRHQSSSQ